MKNSQMKEAKQHIAPLSKRGLLTIEQYTVLRYRARGFSQKETAQALSTSRSNISMIESRARKKLSGARATIRAYKSMRSTNTVVVEKGTNLQELPFRILNEGDQKGVHIGSNVTEIIRLVKTSLPNPTRGGKTTKALKFVFDSRGTLSLAGHRRRRP